MKNISEDGRALRAQKEFKKINQKLINSALELFNDIEIDDKSINITLIAKNANCAVATGYNHFPNGMLDVYGTLIQNVNEIIQKALEQNLEDNISREDIITNLFVETSKYTIQYGNAARKSLFALKEVVETGDWKFGDPYLTLKILCEDLKQKYSINNVENFTVQLYTNYLGLLFSWMRYQEDSIVFSIFTDEWLLNRSKELLEINLLTLK